MVFVTRLLFLASLGVAIAYRQKRLVNGDVAAIGQFPWMVSLRRTASSSHSCGGAIVTPDHVVTAAHCVASNVPVPVDPAALFVVTGHNTNVAGGRFTGIEAVRIHPEYNATAFWHNDIAVLKLLTPIPYNALESPIPMATSNVGIESCVISGWGRAHFPATSLPSQLQTQILNTMTRETCALAWGASAVYESTICAMSRVGEGVCSGDSGGPLICNSELAGVVSWGNPCANGRPDAFARVYSYRSWLAENTADLSPLGKVYMAEITADRAAATAA